MNRKPVLPDVWPTKYPAKSRISNVWLIGTHRHLAYTLSPMPDAVAVRWRWKMDLDVWQRGGYTELSCQFGFSRGPTLSERLSVQEDH